MTMIHKQKTLLYSKLTDALKCHKPIHKMFYEYISFNAAMVHGIVKLPLKWKNPFG